MGLPFACRVTQLHCNPIGHNLEAMPLVEGGIFALLRHNSDIEIIIVKIKTSQWSFSYDESENSWKLFENSICNSDSHGVEDENFGEFLKKSICNKDFQGLKIPFISRKYLQV